MPGYIFTPLGKGKIVYKLPNGTYLVVFDHGGGQIFFPEEIFPNSQTSFPDKQTSFPNSQISISRKEIKPCLCQECVAA